MEIFLAKEADAHKLAPLFDAYRIFYKQTSNLQGAESFLRRRLRNNESIIYYAVLDDNVVGFVQLYPLFSSVSMKPMLLLNDLYVKKEYRDRSIGTKLIDRAKKLCQQTNQKGMAIETAQSNRAQELYQRLGFKKDENLHLFWTNK